jgi:hypothetical protein
MKTLPDAIRTTLSAAALVGLLAATACGTPATSSSQAGPSTSSGTSPSATASASGSAAPSTTAPVSAPAASAPVAAPPAKQTYTFPDGHISFSYPAGWTVTTKPGPALNPDAQKNSFDAAITDQSGQEVARVLSGMYGDGAAGPAKRTVLDHAPVPAINDVRGEAAEFGFAYDEYPGNTSPAYYFMDVRRASEFLAAVDSSGSNQVQLPNGILTASVIFGDSPTQQTFASPDAAKAWMGTEQYAQLKALLISLKYS